MMIPERVRPLIEADVVGPEQCPAEHYWSWPVLKPEFLPADLLNNYKAYGEIRWYPG
jgi:hypothetical protein